MDGKSSRIGRIRQLKRRVSRISVLMSTTLKELDDLRRTCPHMRVGLPVVKGDIEDSFCEDCEAWLGWRRVDES